MKLKRNIIEINEELCNGCGQCVPDCAEGSLKIINGKARLVADNLCDGLGACLGSCPTGALQIVERVADSFDEKAVEEYLALEKNQASHPATNQPPMHSGCPSSRLQSFIEPSPCQMANQPKQQAGNGNSLLSHWPVQIRLVPPTAPFLRNAHLLIAADCTAVSARNFQETYVQGKVVLMGCPKFDDAESYVQRFTEILKTSEIQSITVLIMEVPCCSSMLSLLAKAVLQAQTSIAIEQITLSCQGVELERKKWQ